MESSVFKWATGLTRRHKVFSHSEPLQPQHFFNLTRDSNLQPILAYLAGHVRPAGERRSIRLNLKHARLREKLTGDEGEGASATEERLRLKASIVDAGVDISVERTEIQQLNQRNEELRQREVEVRRRITLLKVAQEEREKEIEHCLLWRSQLSLLMEDLPCSEEGRSLFDMNLQKQLQANLLQLEELRRSIITGYLSSPDRIHEEKLNVWELVEETMARWEPRMLQEALLSNTREATRNLHSQVQNIDLMKDAQILRLKCEKDGTFIDDINPGGLIESARELYVKLYVEADQADRAARSLSRALKSLHNNIVAAAEKTYVEDGVAAAVINVVNESISVSGERAAVHCAEQLTLSMQERSETAAKARDTLRAKHAQITSFNKEVQDRVESIQCLAMCVVDGLQMIKEQRRDIQATVNKAIGAMAYPTPVSRNCLGEESQAFLAVPLSQLLTTKMGEYGLQKKADLSTTPLVWHEHSVNQAGWEAMWRLCSALLSWEGVFGEVCDKQNQAACIHKQMDHFAFTKVAMQNSRRDGDTLTMQIMRELTERVEASDSLLEGEITAQTSKCERQVTQGMQLIAKVNRLFSEWWEQPAKCITML
ncbi:uncharacterized protein LOC119578679 [Penaeus monodon]|uniref:uncharacterized protein LOC119578679 n=1 Tax=Penaeus monodon TaxID=6687 RepID=UPI0018A7D58D|nr:uncharacterized protein LOC119578679 [Penaeus monodon]